MYVDSYCERTAPGLWNEPANAVSNVAFLAASALLIWWLAGSGRRAPGSVWLLPVLLGVVGLCSLSFHTFANTVTAALDTLSILVFILTAVVVLTHWMWQVPWRWAWLVAPAYLAAAFGMNAALAVAGGERATLGGYLPALVGLVGFGVAIRFTAPPDAARFGRRLLLAGAIFSISLALRTPLERADRLRLESDRPRTSRRRPRQACTTSRSKRRFPNFLAECTDSSRSNRLRGLMPICAGPQALGS